MSKLEGKPVRPYQLPITKAWAIGYYEHALKTGDDDLVLTFDTEAEAQAAANQHNKENGFE